MPKSGQCLADTSWANMSGPETCFIKPAAPDLKGCTLRSRDSIWKIIDQAES